MTDTTTGQEIVEEKPQVEVTATEETQDLPEDANERTKQQFEKLKESNQQLKSKLEELEKSQQKDLVDVYESLRPKPGVAQPQVAEAYEALIKDGYVDEEVLKASLNQLTKQAQEAKLKADQAEARVREIEENAQVREANKLYPQLDPKSSSFDPKFYKMVKNELIGQMMEGKKDLLLAADEVSKVYKPTVEVKEKEQAKKEEFEKKEGQLQKQNISTGTRNTRYDAVDPTDLVRATMRNEKGALAERLRRSGY